METFWNRLQSVTYLYDSVLPPTVKCMNYVNSIEVDSDQLGGDFGCSSEESSPIEEKIGGEDRILEIRSIGTEVEAKKGEKLASSGFASVENKNEAMRAEVRVDVEVVELTKSVKETIQFPEIEEIAESGKTNEKSDDSSLLSIETETLDSPTPTLSSINHIDLIKEAKKLSIEEKSNEREICTKFQLSEETLSHKKLIDEESEQTNNNLYNEAYFFEEQSSFAKIEEIDLLSSIGRDIGVDLEKYVQPIPDVVAMETVQQIPPRSLPPNILKEPTVRADTNKLTDQEMLDVSSADTRKKEKMARNQARRRLNSHSTSGQRRPDKRRADHIVDNGPGTKFFHVQNLFCFNNFVANN